MEAQSKLASRPPIANPEQHLRPFVDFLRNESSEPQSFLLQALARHQLLILGEVHHRPRYWAFNSELARTKAFAERVGVIYMELPGNDQDMVDRFLAAPQYDPQPIIAMLRDNLIWGWPTGPWPSHWTTVLLASRFLMLPWTVLPPIRSATVTRLISTSAPLKTRNSLR